VEPLVPAVPLVPLPVSLPLDPPVPPPGMGPLSVGLGEGGLLVPGLVLPGLVPIGEPVPPGAGSLGFGVEPVPPLGADELPDPGSDCARTIVRPSNEKEAGSAGAASVTRTSAAVCVVSVA
jgi:hypothetical protein